MNEIAKSEAKHNADPTCNCENCILRTLVFQYLPENEADRLCSIKSTQTFSKGDSIVKEGDSVHDFFYVKEGLVKLCRLSDQKQNHIITISRPHDYTSLLSLFFSEKHKYTMIALEQSKVCVFPLNDIVNLGLQYGNFAMGLLNKTSRTADDIINHFIEINSRNLRGRIALTLLDFSENIYHSTVFELPVSRKEIAELIGMTTENVIRILSEFRKENIIQISGKIIEIIDFKRLRMISAHG